MNSLISGFGRNRLFFKTLPEKGFAEKKSQTRGGKNSKMRLIIAFFVNAAGEKAIGPLVVWRSKKPCCFKDIKSFSRPHAMPFITTLMMISQTAAAAASYPKYHKNRILLPNAFCSKFYIKGTQSQQLWLPGFCSYLDKFLP